MAVSLFQITAIVSTSAEERLFGDINNDGTVDVEDMLLLKKHILKIELLTGDDRKYANVVTHNDIDEPDVESLLKLKKYILKLAGIETLQPEPVEPPEPPLENGKYRLINWEYSNCNENMSDPSYNVVVRALKGKVTASNSGVAGGLSGEQWQMNFSSTASPGASRYYEIFVNPVADKRTQFNKIFQNAKSYFDHIEGIEFDFIINACNDVNSIYNYLGVQINGVTEMSKHVDVREGKSLGKELKARISFDDLNEIDSISSFSIVTNVGGLSSIDFTVGNVYIYGAKNSSTSFRSIDTAESDTSRRGFTGLDYNLKFIEDFDGSSLNMSNWQYIEHITNGAEQSAYLPENLEIVDGKAVMKTILADKAIYDKKEADWSTGNPGTKITKTRLSGAAIQSKNRVHFQHGMVEAKVKAPWGTGMWSIFWTMGAQAGWPWGGEFDIFEFVGGGGRDNEYPYCIHFSDPTAPAGSARDGAYGGGKIAGGYYGGGSPKTPNRLADGWHIVGLEWTDKELIFYMDGKRHGVIEISNDALSHERSAFYQPHYIILNMCTGGPGSWPGDATQNPLLVEGGIQTFEIDWVKVWQSDQVPGTIFPIGSNR